MLLICTCGGASGGAMVVLMATQPRVVPSAAQIPYPPSTVPSSDVAYTRVRCVQALVSTPSAARTAATDLGVPYQPHRPLVSQTVASS